MLCLYAGVPWRHRSYASFARGFESSLGCSRSSTNDRALDICCSKTAAGADRMRLRGGEGRGGGRESGRKVMAFGHGKTRGGNRWENMPVLPRFFILCFRMRRPCRPGRTHRFRGRVARFRGALVRPYIQRQDSGTLRAKTENVPKKLKLIKYIAVGGARIYTCRDFLPQCPSSAAAALPLPGECEHAKAPLQDERRGSE